MTDEIAEIEKNVKKVMISRKSTDEIIDIIEAWWNTSIKNSKASRNTEIFNFLQTAKDTLTDTFKKGEIR